MAVPALLLPLSFLGLLFSSTVHGYGLGHGQPRITRRHFLHTVPIVAGGASVASAEVISAKRCDSGEGEGCSTVDENDPAAELIMRLRKQSKENASRRVDEELRRYNDNNFADYFRTSGKVLVVHRDDGRMEAIPQGQLNKLVKEGTVIFNAEGYYFNDPPPPPPASASATAATTTTTTDVATDAPADAPVGAPAGAPAEVPAAAPAEVPAEVPAVVPADVPAGAPAGVPAGAGAER